MKTIAITGSSGFIGKHLLNHFKRLHYKIVEIDLTKGIDITKKEDLDKIQHFDIIIHLAARSFVPDSFIYPEAFFYNNFLSTLNVLELARKYNAKVIFFSSYLYGTPIYLPIDEKHPLAPHNPYAQSKLICEDLCEGYFRDFNVPVIIFRPFNIYGEGQGLSFLIPSIISQLENKEINLKDPRPKRDFIFIDDVVSAVIKAVEYSKNDFQVFNLGSGISSSINDVVNIILSLTAHKPSLNFSKEYRQGEVMDTVANITKSRLLLEWTPVFDIRTGLERILKNKNEF
ncbi:MAG: NAD(P)-dependent oxidoreductase [Bacteroidales bacterium]|nr:NAD(P)-dependent oxidoreductase [Bacteroidales bacterium]